MDESVLRQFIEETLQELRVDPKMMKLLRGSEIRPSNEPSEKEARGVAEDWLKEQEGASPHTRRRVIKYVLRKWPQLVKRFRGDKRAAMQTLYNLLDTRSSSPEGV